MRKKYTNHSVSGVHFKLRNYDLRIPGHSTVHPEVPDDMVDRVKAHLEKHHPAVVIHDDHEQIAASPAGQPAAPVIEPIVGEELSADAQPEIAVEPEGVEAPQLAPGEPVCEELEETEGPALESSDSDASTEEVAGQPAAPQPKQAARSKKFKKRR